MSGKEVDSLELDPAVFAAKVNEGLVYQTVRWQLAKRRSGTHSTLTRGDMKGGGRKPWRQKGSGRARAGSNTSPVWVGGGVAHGPKPRSYNSRLSRRLRRQALASVLTDRQREGRITVLDRLEVESGKTRDFKNMLDQLGVDCARGVLVVLPEKDEKVWRAGRNIPGVTLLPVEGANVYDLMRRGHVLTTRAAIEALQQRVLKVASEN
ncbi:MAG: 50S ribosomal protein L4 [Candidatus Dadabacteria bacterium]|nr:MAG: 50S ribosomal protein L4 [Candidatus Dadabacteria bacterium]